MVTSHKLTFQKLAALQKSLLLRNLHFITSLQNVDVVMFDHFEFSVAYNSPNRWASSAWKWNVFNLKYEHRVKKPSWKRNRLSIWCEMKITKPSKLESLSLCLPSPCSILSPLIQGDLFFDGRVMYKANGNSFSVGKLNAERTCSAIYSH